jgi:methyl-accepting chemotaxis protein
MKEVVQSIRRVTDIMGEISAASSEQSAGVAQVGEAVTSMDQATQQNAMLVQEMAAAAANLEAQSAALVEAVSAFRLCVALAGCSRSACRQPSDGNCGTEHNNADADFPGQAVAFKTRLQVLGNRHGLGG